MYNTYYNSNLVANGGKDPLLGNQWRSGRTPTITMGSLIFRLQAMWLTLINRVALAVNKFFFIITGQTASASELTINNLRPEMNVQFIGQTSYGKPVGFFDIDINKYIISLPPNFRFKKLQPSKGGYLRQGLPPEPATYLRCKRL